MAYEPTRLLFTVEQYMAMGEAGVLEPDQRTELIEGEIVEMVPTGPPHARGTTNLTNRLAVRLDGLAVVSPQNPFHLSEMSMPEPDLVLVPIERWKAMKGHPTPGDVALVVEVSDTSLAFDRVRKIPLYAPAGVPEVWIVDVKGRAVDVYRSPAANGYAVIQRFEAGSTLLVEAFPGITFSVDDIFA